MDAKCYERYQAAKEALRQAEYWHNLPQSKHRYNNDSFAMSPAHGCIKFMRCGQHSCGGQNYWESPKELNAAMLEVIAKDPAVIEAGIALLRSRAQVALAECDIFAAELRIAVDAAKAEGK